MEFIDSMLYLILLFGAIGPAYPTPVPVAPNNTALLPAVPVNNGNNLIFLAVILLCLNNENDRAPDFCGGRRGR